MSGGRVLSPSPPVTLGQSWDFSEPQFSSAVTRAVPTASPNPAPGAGTDEGDRKALSETWKHWEVVAEGVLSTLGPSASPKELQ